MKPGVCELISTCRDLKAKFLAVCFLPSFHPLPLFYCHHAHLPWCCRSSLKESVEQREQNKRVLFNVHSSYKGSSSYTYPTAVSPGSSLSCVTTSWSVTFISLHFLLFLRFYISPPNFFVSSCSYLCNRSKRRCRVRKNRHWCRCRCGV
jgi:hypothetical protein